MRSRSAFTLIELLIVMGVLATLATAVVLVLNPAQLLAGARDSTRLSDLAALNSALSYFQTDQYNQSMGTSSVVYISVPDSSPVCANLGLPSLPSGWTYSCSNSVNYQKVDGSGWISINFNLLSLGSPLSRLPIDPVNTTTTGNYYTYTSGGSWELTTLFEATKNFSKYAQDGGADPAMYEVGSDVSLTPFVHGLVGWWRFEEGSGASAYDSSGFGNNGIMYSLSTPTDIHTQTGCKVGGCANFNAANSNYVNVGDYIILPGGKMTIALWAKGTVRGVLFSTGETACGTPGNYFLGTSEMYVKVIACGGASAGITFSDFSVLNLVVGVIDGNTMRSYVNGALQNQVSISGFSTMGTQKIPIIGAQSDHVTGLFTGTIDEVRLYNRALSAAEIQAIYNANQ